MGARQKRKNKSRGRRGVGSRPGVHSASRSKQSSLKDLERLGDRRVSRSFGNKRGSLVLGIAISGEC